MRKLILILAMLLVLPGVFAFTADLEPVALYETNTANINLSVDNFLGNGVINDIVLNTGLLTVDSVQAFIGWQNSFTANEAHWYDGTVETNIAKALFIFSSTLPKVDSDSEISLAGTVTYADSSTESFTITFEILNDATPPEVNNYLPQDYVMANKADQLITVNASDPETGVDSATYSFNDCSGNSTTVALACNAGICTGTADFTGFDEGETSCFEISVKNKARETRTITGTLGFDGTPPVVTLVSPINNDYAGQASIFTFSASDNTADNLECSVLVNNDVVYSATVANNSEAQFMPVLAGLAEGVQEWKVRCDDEVGLSTINTDHFTYDNTPPVITLNSPSNGSTIGNRMIDVSATDNGAVDAINYSKSLDTSVWPDGTNNLIVTTTDKAGNTASAEFTFYVDRTAPTIALISPVNGSTFDYNAVFTVRVEDNYDTELECSLETNVGASAASNVAAGIESSISLLLPLGDFAWHLTCIDDAGNSAESETYYGTAVDMSGPIIGITDVRYVVRGHDLNVDSTITDISGVDIATATFSGNTIALSKSGDDYAGTFTVDANTALGNYTFTVDANDTSGYTSTASDTFEVIEGYVITINMPSSVTPGATVSLTGSVVQDDGSIPSGTVIVEYAGGNASITLDSGNFGYSFTAPSTDGNYTVKVKYETSRFIYTREKQYTVSTASSSGSRGGGHEGVAFTAEGAGTTPTVQESSNSELQTNDEASASELVTQDEETPTQVYENEVPPAAPRSPIAGQATSLLNALGKNIKWLALLITLMAVGTAFYLAYRGKKPGSKIDWNNYFD